VALLTTVVLVATQRDRSTFCSVTFITGWHGLEQSDQGWLRWTHGEGQVRVFVVKDTNAVLRGEINSIQRPNKVDIVLNGDNIATWDITWNEWAFRPFDTVLMRLKAGENLLEFISDNPPIQLPTDSRPLTIAVKNLNLVVGEKPIACTLEL